MIGSCMTKVMQLFYYIALAITDGIREREIHRKRCGLNHAHIAAGSTHQTMTVQRNQRQEPRITILNRGR